MKLYIKDLIFLFLLYIAFDVTVGMEFVQFYVRQELRERYVKSMASEPVGLSDADFQNLVSRLKKK